MMDESTRIPPGDVLLKCRSLAAYLTDLQGTITFWSAGAEELFGYRSSEVVGSPERTLYEGPNGRSYGPLIEARYRLARNRTTDECNVAVDHRNGARLWLNLKCESFTADDGSPLGIIVLAARVHREDVSASRLLRSNERYRTLLQLLPDIVYIIDPEGHFTFLSQSVASLGYTPEELIGKHFSVIVHPDDCANVSRQAVLPRFHGRETGEKSSPKLFDERRSGRRKTSNLEVRLIPKDWRNNSRDRVAIVSAVSASGHYSSIDEAHGGKLFVGTIGVIRDITDRKQVEEEHRRLESKLHQAQKMEAIGSLAGGIAHDFNNMLAGISGYAEVIKRKNRGLDGKIKDHRLDSHINVILKASERAGDLTSKLLAFARRGKYQVILVNVHDTIHEVIALLRHTIDRRIEIGLSLKSEPCYVLGDPTQLQNAVLNLAMNGVDAMPNGGSLSFTTEVVEFTPERVKALPYHMTPGKYVRLTVSDTGVGMDKSVKRRIFEPFFTTKDVGKGTGLGLASVYGTVKSHHGSVEATSTVGQGSDFIVHLPLQDPPTSRSIQNTEAIKTGKGKILVVDDEEVVRRILTQMLLEIGYTVSSCTNGMEAVQFYRQHGSTIDLVILDMNMPVMNGIDCFRELRSLDEDVKVIITTGYSFQSETQQIIMAGVAGFIPKPFKLSSLSSEIQKALEDTETHSETDTESD